MGLPTGLQFALEVGAFATLSLMISLFSEVEMASHHIAIQVIHLSFLPAFAVAEAASVLTGQAVGAGAYHLVKRAAHLAMGITTVYAGAWSALLALGAPLIVSGFTADPAIVSVGTGLLHVAAVFQIFDAWNMVARCSLRGAGDVRYAAVVGVLTSWLCTPTLAWVLGKYYKLGAFGGWLGLCLEIIVSSAILWWRIERRGWLPAATMSRARLTADQELDRRSRSMPMATAPRDGDASRNARPRPQKTSSVARHPPTFAVCVPRFPLRGQWDRDVTHASENVAELESTRIV